MLAVTRRTRRDLLSLSVSLGAAGLAGCVDFGPGGRGSPLELDGTDRPTTGESVSELAAVEETVLSFMTANAIPGGAIAVAKDGTTVLERGYGYRNENGDPVEPDTLFRIASLSKAFTRAAIRSLIRAERLAYDQPAIPLLELEPLPGETYNEQLDGITIEQLLSHQGGWDREQAFDPAFTQLDIALERGWTDPPTTEQVVRYMLSEPLQFEPGTDVAYSNFGYTVLGQVIEAVTGTPYQMYIQQELFEPHGIVDIEPGRSLPADRPARESWYFDKMACRNAVAVDPYDLVRCPDGGFHLESIAAAGGQVATAGALCSFLAHYWLSGEPRRRDRKRTRSYNGTLPGTFSLAFHYSRGVDVTLMFNQRGYDPNYLGIHEELRAAISGIETWPG